MKRILQTTAILLIPFFLFSQELGKIAGKASDEATGEPLAGANVLVEGTSFGAATDAEGNYIILGVPVGTYTLRGEFIGYRPLRISNVRVSSRLTTAANFALTSEAIELGVVEVVAERPLINPSATNAVRSITSDQIENLATRNVTEFFNIQAGIVVQNSQLHIRGGRPDEVGYELEGATTRAIGVGSGIQSGGTTSLMQDVGGTNRFNFGVTIPEALEEVSVQSGGYGADLGGANAGIVQQKLKTGGSTLSGKVLYETDALAPTIGEALDGALGTDESYSYNTTDITVTLGGPLLSQRIRFFGAYQKLGTDDHNPQFWHGAAINEGKPIEDLIAGLTPSGDSVAVQWEDGIIPNRDQGVRRGEADIVNGTLLLDFHPLVLRVGGFYSKRTTRLNALPIRYMFNPERLGQNDVTSQLLNAKATFFLSPTTMLNFNASTFGRFNETYDPNFEHETFEDLLDWSDSVKVAEKAVELGYVDEDGNPLWVYKTRWTDPDHYNLAGFAFHRPGEQMTGYGKGEQSYIAFNGGLVSQAGAHELRAGFDWRRWTYRAYNFGAMSSVNQELGMTPALRDNLTARDEIARRFLRKTRAYGVGYDEFGEEVGDDHNDRPRHPWNLSYYLNDKVEMNDIIINAGLRVDQYNLDDYVITTFSKDVSSGEYDPPYDAGNYTVKKDLLEESETRSIIQPRLGLAFPLTDKSVFHLQYGKFAQFPDMALLYTSWARMALIWGGGYFFSNPSFGFDRDPIITTQYEVGYTQQLGEAASFDVTAFARYSTGQLVVETRAMNPNITDASSYVIYNNGDFTTVSGLEFTLNTRRVGPFQGLVSYAWTDARGTNSFPNSNASNLDSRIQRPSLITPMLFAQKHRGALNLDVRFGENEGGLLFANSGMNILFTFNSGHPFTKSVGSMGQRGPDEGALLTDGDARNRHPAEPIGSSTTPWVFNTDLKVDKTFKVGGASLQAYLLVSNLFNRQNSINVYCRTGNAYDDGFLSSPELSQIVVEGQGATYEEMYRAVNLGNRQHYIADQGFDLFARPRQIKVGIAVGF